MHEKTAQMMLERYKRAQSHRLNFRVGGVWWLSLRHEV